MDFIFADKGNNYSVIYGNGSDQEQKISEYIQNSSFFDSALDKKSYFYKTVHADNSNEINTISVFCNRDNDNGDSACYYHVICSEQQREYFQTKEFIDSFLQPFAEYEDVKLLKENNILTVENKFGRPLESLEACEKLLKSVLCALYSQKKVILVLNSCENFDVRARQMLSEIYKYLNVSMRLKTPWAVGCNTDSFESSEYAICVVSSDSPLQESYENSVVIREDDSAEYCSEELSAVIDFIISSEKNDREKFFAEFDAAIGAYENDVCAQSFRAYYDAVKKGDPSAVVNYLVNSVSVSDKVVFSAELENVLREYHDTESGYLLNMRDFKIDGIEKFIRAEYDKLKYLSTVYGNDEIPELSSHATRINDLLANMVIKVDHVENKLPALKEKYNQYAKEMSKCGIVEKKVYSYYVPGIAKHIFDCMDFSAAIYKGKLSVLTKLSGKNDINELNETAQKLKSASDDFYKNKLDCNVDFSLDSFIDKKLEEELELIKSREELVSSKTRNCTMCDKFFEIPLRYLRKIINLTVDEKHFSGIYEYYPIEEYNEAMDNSSNGNIFRNIWQVSFKDNVKVNGKEKELYDMAFELLIAKFTAMSDAGNLLSDTFMNYVVYQLLEYTGTSRNLIVLRNRFMNAYYSDEFYGRTSKICNPLLMDIALAPTFEDLKSAIEECLPSIVNPKDKKERADSGATGKVELRDVYKAIYLSFMALEKCEIVNKVDLIGLVEGELVCKDVIDKNILLGFAYNREYDGNTDSIPYRAKRKLAQKAKVVFASPNGGSKKTH